MWSLSTLTFFLQQMSPYCYIHAEYKARDSVYLELGSKIEENKTTQNAFDAQFF